MTDIDDYLKVNLVANKSKENRKKFTANEPYSSIATISDIDKGTDLTKSEQELQDILPISPLPQQPQTRVDRCKPVDLIQYWYRLLKDGRNAKGLAVNKSG